MSTRPRLMSGVVVTVIAAGLLTGAIAVMNTDPEPSMQLARADGSDDEPKKGTVEKIPPNPPKPVPGELTMKQDHPENRLAKESSPYLLQHARNPVDWYPWGKEAFDRAKELDRPIFLSIGYSTCHWCHVMERECFENEAIAKLMNAHFVCIKVDREERPDVDAVYMDAVQALTGQGGWPMSVFLTPDLRPFYGGTYFPPADRAGRPGFPTVLTRISELWTNQRSDVLDGATRLTTALKERGGPGEARDLSAEWHTHGVEQFRAAYDAANAGFGPAPKFPRAFAMSYLLSRAGSDQGLRTMTLNTLDAMARGGIHDQLGGGFHRYSTDREWLVPHFEKMLYDQAILCRAYLDGYQVTGNEEYARVARDVVEYVLRDLRDSEGGFHSAEDADSEGEEGKFYVWTNGELAEALGDADAKLVQSLYQTTDAGNYVDEAARRRTGANILHLKTSLEDHAKTLGVLPSELNARLAKIHATLLGVRVKRIRPHLDDKVLTDWNGLMIGAMARAGRVLKEDRFIAEATRAAQFVLGSMKKDGRLFHRWRKGDLAVPGFLEDHAYLALGLMDLYEATFDPRWLAEAVALCQTITSEFQLEDGTFRTASAAGEALFHAPRDLYDGALPSGNSMAALALVRAGQFTGNDAFTEASRRCLSAWAATIENYPMGYVVALEAAQWHLTLGREIVIAGDPTDPATTALIDVARSRLLPSTVVILHPSGDAGKAIEAVVPFVAGQGPVNGKAAAYVCTARTCKAPVTTAEGLAESIKQ